MYTEDKARAKEFLRLYGNDNLVKETLSGLNAFDISHSERWSIVYDMIVENYPREWRGVTTGLVYLVEDGEYDG